LGGGQNHTKYNKNSENFERARLMLEGFVPQTPLVADLLCLSRVIDKLVFDQVRLQLKFAFVKRSSSFVGNYTSLCNTVMCVSVKFYFKEDEVNGVHVVVFADESDPEGFEFLQMIKEIAQSHIENEDLSVVWIDPDDFALVFFSFV